MNVFQSVKEAVSTRTAAEMYGIKVGQNGMARCPFQDDHCFGCGADGDVIDFTAQLFTIGKMEAARKLASDFGIPYDGGGPSGQQKKSGSKAGKK